MALDDRDRPGHRGGFVIGASLMIAAGPVELMPGIRAERQSLEDIAPPLTAADVTRS